MTSTAKPYLSACAIYRDEGPYLREWVEFHRLVGFERFFLYDNLSTDDHREQLAPYVEEGIVVPHEWPYEAPAQLGAYNDCLERYRDASRWLAIIDIDEFLFSPTMRKVSELLADYEYPGVVVNWAMYGTSGHETPPPGLVIENYLHRTDEFEMNRRIKTIMDPTRVAEITSSHFVRYTDGVAVTENMEPIERQRTLSVSWNKLRINHYWTRSEQEAFVKLDRPRIFDAKPYMGAAYWTAFGGVLNEVRDETILPYAPAVREALARVEQGSPR